jgi:hypothetical protein
MSSSSSEGGRRDSSTPPVADSGTSSGGNNVMMYAIIFMLVALAGAAAYYFLVFQKKNGSEKNKSKKDVDVDEAVATNSVGLQDISYIASKLSPDSTHLDVLLAVATSPESIAWGTKAYLRREKIKKERLDEEKKEKEENKKLSSSKASSSSGNMFELDDEGWAEDDDDMDDEAKEKAKLAKEAEEQKKKEREELKQASGKVKIPLEDLDEGVIGQKWVEATLEKAGAWPLPDLRFVKEMTFEYEGKKVSAMDHPGVRRNLCHIAGRINSIALNSHPDLRKFRSHQGISTY